MLSESRPTLQEPLTYLLKKILPAIGGCRFMLYKLIIEIDFIIVLRLTNIQSCWVIHFLGKRNADMKILFRRGGKTVKESVIPD